MDIVFILIPLTFVLAIAAVIAFRWALRSGQFEDLRTPATRVLYDDVKRNSPRESTNE